MQKIKDTLRWEYGFESRHAVLIGSLLFSVGYFFAVNVDMAVPNSIGMSSVFIPVVITYSLLKSSQSERVTLVALSTVVFFSSSLLSNVPGEAGVSPESIALLSVSATMMIVVGFGLVALIAGVLWDRWMGRNRGATPEERVLTTEEYAKFEGQSRDTELLHFVQAIWSTVSQ
jgi:hypothetical protein